ncbi:MAG TPA: NUDIX hydrolase [Alphaproteobacteria bacterium]|nr:NUDIX hydrolase [Alphaproteobacteria bacterium]
MSEAHVFERSQPVRQKIKRPHAMGVVMDAYGRVLTGIYGSGNGKKGQRGLPGGGIDEGESPVDAIVRETFEETGLAIKVLPQYVWQFACADKHLQAHIGIARVCGQFFPLDTPEMHTFQWHRIERLLQLELSPRSRQGLELVRFKVQHIAEAMPYPQPRTA